MCVRFIGDLIIMNVIRSREIMGKIKITCTLHYLSGLIALHVVKRERLLNKQEANNQKGNKK
jgi:hypothetical protein